MEKQLVLKELFDMQYLALKHGKTGIYIELCELYDKTNLI